MKHLKAALSPAQAKLTTTGELKLTDKREPAKPFVLDETNQYMCPFCLHIGYQREFLIYKDDKPVTYRVQCPECENTFLMKTLMSEWSIIEFADWVADYVHSGFWQKCDFEKFNQRLKELGWARLFWDRYRAVTGKVDEEYYTRIARHVREENADDIGRYGRE
jgi:hypothetical protein